MDVIARRIVAAEVDRHVFHAKPMCRANQGVVNVLSERQPAKLAIKASFSPRKLS